MRVSQHNADTGRFYRHAEVDNITECRRHRQDERQRCILTTQNNCIIAVHAYRRFFGIISRGVKSQSIQCIISVARQVPCRDSTSSKCQSVVFSMLSVVANEYLLTITSTFGTLADRPAVLQNAKIRL